MLNFLKSTEINKFLPKEKLIDKLDLSTALKESLKNDVKRFTIANELSPKSMNISKGETVSAVFVMEVLLKEKNIDYKLIEAVAKQNTHKLLFVLHHEDEMQLAVFYGKLYRGQWVKESDLSIEINGDTFDAVWDNIIGQIALGKQECVELILESDVDTLLEKKAQQEKLQQEIIAIENKIKSTKQFNLQVKLKQELQKLKKDGGEK